MGITLPSAAWAAPQQDVFVIYDTKNRPPAYDRDARWEIFFQQGLLTRPLLTDDDIEVYDWDNQAIILTETASRNFNQSINFIAALGRERLYGGTMLDVMSQMAIRYPVIYPLDMENRAVLLIRTYHSLDRKINPDDVLWKKVAPPELKDHFKRLGKLRQPWSESSFIRFQKSIHRIQALHLTKIKTSIEADFDLEGTRQGVYYIYAELSLAVGNGSSTHGQAYQDKIEIHAPKTHRKLSFPMGYYESKLAELISQTQPKDGKMAPDPVWRVFVYIQPILNEQESASFDVAAKINLRLLSKYDYFPSGMQENHAKVIEPLIAESKAAEIAVR